MGNSIWGSALDAARDIFGGLIGDLLGWAIVIGLLTPLFLIIYFIMKKTGWRGLYPDPYGKKGTFRLTLGGPNPSDQIVQKLLSDPRAHAEIVKLDAADPQARAKLEQVIRALQAFGSTDPKIKAAMEQAMQKLGAGVAAQAGQSPSPMTSEVIFASGVAGAPENFSAAASGTPIPPAPAIIDSSAGTPLGGGAGWRSATSPHASEPAAAPILDPSVSNPLGGTPDWQKELQVKWQKERDDLAHEEHVAFVRSVEQNRSNLRSSARAVLQPLRYFVAGLGVAAVVACFMKARADPGYNILGIALAVATVWAWSSLSPSQFD